MEPEEDEQHGGEQIPQRGEQTTRGLGASGAVHRCEPCRGRFGQSRWPAGRSVISRIASELAETTSAPVVRQAVDDATAQVTLLDPSELANAVLYAVRAPEHVNLAVPL